jgi:hypothetical protein
LSHVWKRKRIMNRLRSFRSAAIRSIPNRSRRNRRRKNAGEARSC